MKLRALLFTVCVLALGTQTGAQTPVLATGPVAPGFSAYYRVQGQASGYVYQWISIDPGLTFTLDASGLPHLGVQFQPVPPLEYIPPPTSVHNEIPVATQAGWQLQFVPLNGATCYVGGVRQTPGTDYTLFLSGLASTSAAWTAAGAVIACDYEYR